MSAVALKPAASDAQQAICPDHAAFAKCRSGDFEGAVKLLDSDLAAWHSISAEGQTLLHWGAIMNNVPFVSRALQANVPVDCRTPTGRTPLAWAAFRGRLEAARALLAASANPSSRDSDGATPMLVAISKQQHLFMLFLMSCGSQDELLRNVRRHDGRGPAHYAASKGDLDCLKLLDYFNVDLAACDANSMTALHCAVEDSQAQVLGFLVERNLDPLQADAAGRTCLDIACKSGHEGIQRELKQLLGQIGTGLNTGSLEGDSEFAWGHWSQLVGILIRLRDRVLDKIWPVTWVICVALSLLSYFTQLRIVVQTAVPRVCHVTELLTASMLSLYAYVQLSDPGIIPSPPRGRSGVEAIMRALESGQLELAGGPISFYRLCTTTWVYKGLRTKYCTLTRACVDVFDHRCWWMNCTIGRGNHRAFLSLVCMELSVQVCWLLTCAVFVYNRTSFESLPQWYCDMMYEIHLTSIVVLAHSVTLGGVVYTLCNQLYLISMNLTVNESVNMKRYSHFWEMQDSGRVMKNPFDKGSVLQNWIDFWWSCRRSERGPSICMALGASKSCKDV